MITVVFQVVMVKDGVNDNDQDSDLFGGELPN